jgi:hypothetical protein
MTSKRRHKPADNSACSYKPRKLAYAIGVSNTDGSIEGLTDGPFGLEISALDCIGGDAHVIVRFNTDGTDDVIWHWCSETQEWVEA